MNILVIGSEGNIGSRLVPYLRSVGHSVDRADFVQGCGDDYTVVDIKSATGVNELIAKLRPAIVFNLAAMVSRVTCEQSPALAIETNINGAFNVAMACRLNYARLINYSTSEVYGNVKGGLSEHRSDLEPNNVYGVTKLMSERMLHYFDDSLDCVTIRPFMLYDELETMGAHRSAMIRFAEVLLSGGQIDVHIGATRSWLHMSDAVEMMDILATKAECGVYNIGHPHAISVKELATKMCDKLGLDYSKHVREILQPQRMTLLKHPDLERQLTFTRFVPQVDIDEGIERVLTVVKRRLHE